MCGIGGFVKTHRINPTFSREALLNSLSHRGPDNSDFFENENFCLVHTRLSIIDLSSKGNQPLYNESKSLVLICNGEIYNFQVLRKKLIEKGHFFYSSSDSEVIIHLYEEFNGDIHKVCNELVGMFAFCLADIEKNILIIARDRIGIKPLYYTNCDQFAFSSEVFPLVHSKLSSDQIDCTSLYEYLKFGYIPEPSTWYESVNSLPPGSFAIFSGTNLTIEKFWTLKTKINSAFKSIDEVKEEFDYRFKNIIQDHLISDVPLGTFLSAGIDSSLVTYYSANQTKSVTAYTASFPGEEEDEFNIAKQTADKLGLKCYAYKISTDFFANYDEHFKYIDQPFGITSSLSLSRISEFAKRNVKVVLTGDGADELFAGYDRHENFYSPPYFKYIPSSLSLSLLKIISKTYSNNKLEELIKFFSISEPRKYFNRLSYMNELIVRGLLSFDILPKIDFERYYNKIQTYWNKYEENDFLNRLLYVDIHSSLVDEMLYKTDRMTMNNGIEARVPFLDHRIVELAMTIPGKFKRGSQIGKLPLRALAGERLSSDLAYRKKTGFNSPLMKMLENDNLTFKSFDAQINKLEDYPLISKSALKDLDIFNTNIGDSSLMAFSLFSLSKFVNGK